MRGRLALLWMKGIFLVRITWMMRVCVKMDSMNQPVLKRAGLFQPPKKRIMTK
jgi:hypothetical protein